MGSGVKLMKYAETLVSNDVNKQKALENASKHLYAFMYLRNSDQAKYGSVPENLNQQKSLGNDQYTKTITKAKKIISNH